MPKPKEFLRRFGVDRAVSYAMAARIWQIPSGVVTTLLIALCFAPDEQGVYYLILTLTGLQALADAGLINTLMHAASHEFAGARIDDRGFFRGPSRARARLSAMTRFALGWFSVAAGILVLVGLVAGCVLLDSQDRLAAAIAPTGVAMILAGAVLTLSPLVAILEGCNQVDTVNRYRCGQVVTGSLVVWGCMMAGGGLWTAAMSIATQLVWEIGLLGFRYREFFVQLLRTQPGSFDWRVEIWPLQLRLGVQSVARYLAFLPIYPVLFAGHGPVLAGRYGMTWQVISNLMMVSYVYVRTRTPELGRLIAEGRHRESASVFKRATFGSTVLLAVLVLAFCATLAVLVHSGVEVFAEIAGRFLLPTICIWFALAVIPMHLAQCFSMAIRSQRIDPIWRVSIPSCLILAVLTVAAASSGRTHWIAIAMLVTFSVTSFALARMWIHYAHPSADAPPAKTRSLGGS